MKKIRTKLPVKLSGRKVVKEISLDFLQSDFAKNHRRLSVFANKGLRCSVPGCKCEGSMLIETVQMNKDGSVSGVHIDLYTEDFILMTVDHHVPLSKGGSNDLVNKNPMCEPHNSKKSNLSAEVFLQRIT